MEYFIFNAFITVFELSNFLIAAMTLKNSAFIRNLYYFKFAYSSQNSMDKAP